MTQPVHLAGFLDGLRPAVHLLPSEWADERRFLSSSAAAEPGRWRTDRTPYLREIMDCFDIYSEVQEVVIMKGAQLGLTEAGFNVAGYFIDMDPCPIMYVMPTDATVKRNSKLRFDPMVRESPTLAAKVSAGSSRSKSNTMLQKDYPGGTMIFQGANTASGLRSVPIRVLIFDETDAFPSDLDGEGSPIELGLARTRTFEGTKKVLKISTPTLADTSVIAAEFASTDQRYYHIPCPHCGTFQVLEWENIIFDSDATRVTEAHYQCEGCEVLIEERHKTKMLAAGQWIATNTDGHDPQRRGYHINSFYSPLGWFSWVSAANQFLKAFREHDQAKMKVFVNTVQGKAWEETTVTPRAQDLYERRGGYRSKEVPAQVTTLTAGVDIQGDRIEVEVVGWAQGMRAYSIDYVVLPGNTNQPEVWARLSQLLYTPYERADGATIGLSRMCVDSGFNTQEVYNFCREHPGQIVVPVKGQDNDRQKVMIRPPQVVDVKANGKKVGKVGLWNLGVSMIKQEVYGRLMLGLTAAGDTPPGYCFFPEDYDMTYFNMLASERLAKRLTPQGYYKFVWEKIQARNEALDCRVYARAAAAMLGLDRWRDEHWERAKANAYAPKSPTDAKKTKQKPKPRKDSIWG
jgi:phage terminase large subunit GpA-like protein